MRNTLTLCAIALITNAYAQDSAESGGKCPLGHDRK